jgi:hypothetical protein
MRMFRFAGAAYVCAFALGCGGAKPVSVSVPTAAPVAAAPPELAPLSPVSAPSELFALARVANAAKIMDTGIGWSGLPMDWRSMLRKNAPGVEDVLVMSAPVDFTAMLDPAAGEEPRVLWAVAFGVTGTDAAANFFRQAGLRVTPDVSGAYRVRVGKSLECVIVRALGAAPARVVCSDSAGSTDALSPYMSRGLPSETFGTAEIHAHVLAEPFRHRYGPQLALVRTVGVPFALRELSLDEPKFDRPLRDVLYSLADEVIALAYDLDQIDVEASFSADGNAADASFTMALSGQRSFWGQTMARAAGHGAPAPETFWKLPSDVTSASYNGYSDPDHVRGIVASLRELGDGYLAYQTLPEARRTPLMEAFEQMMTTSAHSAYGSLPIEPGPAAAPNTSASVRESVRVALGSHLFVVDQSGDKFMQFVSEIVKSISDRALRAHLVKTKVARADQLPTARERAPKNAKGLPPGSRAYEFVIPGALFPDLGSSLALASLAAKPSAHVAHGEKPGAPITAVLVAAPDGPLTWFGFGTDESALVTRLAAEKAGTAKTLATRDGLGALKTDAALSGGFSSFAAVIAGLGQSFGGALPLGSSASLTRLPHKGETPMVWHMNSDATGPRVTATTHVPKELVEDIVALSASQIAAGIAK